MSDDQDQNEAQQDEGQVEQSETTEKTTEKTETMIRQPGEDPTEMGAQDVGTKNEGTGGNDADQPDA